MNPACSTPLLPAVSTAVAAAGAAAGTAATMSRWASKQPTRARVSLSASLQGATRSMVRRGSIASWSTCGSVMVAVSPLHSASTAQQSKPRPNGQLSRLHGRPSSSRPSWRCPPRSVASSSGLHCGALVVRWPPHRAFLAVPSSIGGLLIGPSLAVPSSFSGLLIGPSWRCPPCSVASSSGLLGGALLVRWPPNRASSSSALLIGASLTAPPRHSSSLNMPPLGHVSPRAPPWSSPPLTTLATSHGPALALALPYPNLTAGVWGQGQVWTFSSSSSASIRARSALTLGYN